MSSRTKRVYYNVISKGLYQVLVVIASMILPRFILQYYGSEYNGIVSSITQILSFVSILRLGVAGATRVELYKTLSDDDVAGTSSIIKSNQNFMRKIAYVFVICLLVMMIVYPFMIETSYNWIEIATLVLFIGIGTFAEYFFGITYITLLDADQRAYIYTWLQIGTTALNLVVSTGLIVSGCSIQFTKLVSAFLFASYPVFLNLYIPKFYHLDKAAKPDDTALKKRGDVMASSIANIVHDNTDIIVLTIFSNPLVISIYTIYNLVMNGLRMVAQVFTTGLEAFFGDMWVKKEKDNLYRYLEVYEYFMAAFVVVIFSSAMVLLLPFVKLYTEGVNDTNYYLPIYAGLVVVTQACFCMRMPYVTLVQAAGKYKETKHAAYMEAAVNIVLSVVLTIRWGIYGVVVGTFVANVIRTTQYAAYISRELLPRPMKKFLFRILWVVFNMSIVVTLCQLIIKQINLSIDTWGDWLFVGIIVFLIAVVECIISSWLTYRKDITFIMKRLFRSIQRL